VDELTRRRLAHNEELFREINDARDQSHEGPSAQNLTFVCECSDRGCDERIVLSASEYEQIRESPNRFIVVPGHEIPEIERIVEERGAFDVVEKDAA
jgi:hypothetical protein